MKTKVLISLLLVSSLLNGDVKIITKPKWFINIGWISTVCVDDYKFSVNRVGEAVSMVQMFKTVYTNEAPQPIKCKD